VTRMQRIAWAVLVGTEKLGNGIAYVVFGLIALLVIVFLIRWAYADYWTATHCTMVLGTRVCQ
jgi:hypothetical protein